MGGLDGHLEGLRGGMDVALQVEKVGVAGGVRAHRFTLPFDILVENWLNKHGGVAGIETILTDLRWRNELGIGLQQGWGFSQIIFNPRIISGGLRLGQKERILTSLLARNIEAALALIVVGFDNAFFLLQLIQILILVL